MTLNELRAVLGQEVLVVTGSTTEGFTKWHGSLDNVIANAIYYPDKTEGRIEATVTITDNERPHTIQVSDKRVFPLAQEAVVDRSEEHTSELQSRLHLVC